MAILYENTPALQTERLILRRFKENDAGALLELLSDVEVNTFLPWFPLTTVEQADAFLRETFLRRYAEHSCYNYAICLKERNAPIGYVTMSAGESRDLGYGLKKELWHRGIATEAAKAVVERVKAAGYPYITATHDVNNPRSGEVMKKLGMTYKYSYVEQWQPKNIPVAFRMYQLNFDGDDGRTYMEYWNKCSEHFIERGL